MKRIKLFFAAATLCAAITVCCNFDNLHNKYTQGRELLENVEAITECEIVKNENVIFQCAGESGYCDASKLGYTLICSGEEIEK